jgi:hypothetical protein
MPKKITSLIAAAASRRTAGHAFAIVLRIAGD